MLAVSLIVFVIGQDPEVDRCEPGMCGGTAMVTAFQQAAQRVLGSDARVRIQLVSADPPDDEVASKAMDVDGAVELSFSAEGQKARLHCYVARERRWLDREISFGGSRSSARNEMSERGRLLGFSVATMYAGNASDTESEAEAAPGPSPTKAASPELAPSTPAPTRDRGPSVPVERPIRRMAEFGASLSFGTAAGLGASAAVRLGLAGPVWGRLFVAGRTGNIPEAQASTRTVLMGGGAALQLLPESASYELGARLDAFASYFEASHLSEDDVQPDRKSRWQLGGALVAEAGWRPTPGAGIFVGAGVEGMLGETAIYTHHERVAVVTPFRATTELGFRVRF